MMTIPGNLPTSNIPSSNPASTIAPHIKAFMETTIVLDKIAIAMDPKKVPAPITSFTEYSGANITKIMSDWRNDLLGCKKDLQDAFDLFGPKFSNTYSKEIETLFSTLDNLGQEKDFNKFQSTLSDAYEALDDGFSKILNQQRGSSEEYEKILGVNTWNNWVQQFDGKMRDPRFPQPGTSSAPSTDSPLLPEPPLTPAPPPISALPNEKPPISEETLETITKNYLSFLDSYHNLEKTIGVDTSKSEDEKIEMMQQFRESLNSLLNNIKPVSAVNSPLIVQANSILKTLIPRLAQSFLSGDPDNKILLNDKAELNKVMDNFTSSFAKTYPISISKSLESTKVIEDIKENITLILETYHKIQILSNGGIADVIYPLEKKIAIIEQFQTLTRDLIKKLKEIQSENSPLVVQANKILQTLTPIRITHFLSVYANHNVPEEEQAEMNRVMGEFTATATSTFSLTLPEFATKHDIINNDISIIKYKNKILNLLHEKPTQELYDSADELTLLLNNLKKNIIQVTVLENLPIIDQVDDLIKYIRDPDFISNKFVDKIDQLDTSLTSMFLIEDKKQNILYVLTKMEGAVDDVKRNFETVFFYTHQMIQHTTGEILPYWDVAKTRLLQSLDSVQNLRSKLFPMLPPDLETRIKSFDVSNFKNVISDHALGLGVYITQARAESRVRSFKYISDTELTTANESFMASWTYAHWTLDNFLDEKI